jgi:hypothetical protein
MTHKAAPAALVGFAASCAFAWTVPIAAHEIGTTRASVVLDAQGHYRVDIVTDAPSLVEKLEALSGGTPAPDRTAAQLEVSLSHLGDVFRKRVTLAFDGARVEPAIAVAVSAGDAMSAPRAAIALTGGAPPGAKTMSWTYGWTFASYALSVRSSGAGDAATEWLEGGQTSRAFALGAPERHASQVATFARYIMLGFTHILPKGVDHVLFVLGLFLLSRRVRPLLMQVSAFTLAHSITLGLSMYHIVTLPASVVEPLIAVSIAYVAIENLFIADLTRWRVALVFAFGLLHGLGFAGALGELGLPRSAFVTALFGFNLGVETGQLTVIAAAFTAVGWRWGGRSWYRHAIVVPASAVIACIAVYWTIHRLSW